MRRVPLLAAVLIVSVSAASGAHAYTVTIGNTTNNVAYSTGTSGGPYDFYNNGTSAVGTGPVGDEFATSQLAITSTQLSTGNYAIDLQYTTLFSGSETVAGQTVSYPDIFLRTSPMGYSNAGFNYAISLGDQTSNGGLSAGFYSVSSYLTSQQVWSSRPGYIYTGQYAATGNYQPGDAGFEGYDAPVTLTGGSELASSTTTSTLQANGTYVVDVQMTLSADETAMFNNGYDVYWGTGDCSNGSFLATVGDVPEPATLTLLAAGLLSIGTLVMRRRMAAPQRG